ncbi:MAG: HAMP domain-containing histidine kinase [Chitinophagaceae bacterium]|nr:HAMP domain-containing histidine kinase [Chitinophagaceae bacterium]
MPPYYPSLITHVRTVQNIGTESIKEEDQLRRVHLVNTISLAIVCLTFVIGMSFFLPTRKASILAPVGIEFFISFIPMYLNHKKKYVTAALLIYLTLSMASLYFGLLLRTVVELQSIVFLLLLINFRLFSEPLIRRVCFCIAIIVLVALEANQYILYVEPFALSEPSFIVIKTLFFFQLFCLIVITGAPYIKSHDLSYRLKRSLKKEESQSNAKSVFIRNVSHEIQGSFLGITKMSQSLRTGIENHLDVRSLADELIEACHTYKRMLVNLLEYAKVDAGVSDSVCISRIDIRAYVSKIIGVNTYAATDKGVQIHLVVSDEMPEFIKSDEIMLMQVLNNLLTNAIKFTRPNSNICVSIERAGDCFRISVQDEGAGIPEEKLKSVFNLFVTDRNAGDNREGVGLGLFITKHLVEDLLKGAITVKSQMQTGTCFQVSLPFEIE